MACDKLENYSIVTKFSGYLLLYEDTSAIDFGPDSSTRFQDIIKKTGLAMAYEILRKYYPIIFSVSSLILGR